MSVGRFRDGTTATARCRNLTFGGPDQDTLYETAGNSLYRVPVEIVPEPSTVTAGMTGALLLLLAWRRMVNARNEA